MGDGVSTVTVREGKITIPTYGIGKPDKNPMFLEKRVYQGSSGKVYPFPVIDKIYDSRKDAEYHAVFLENEYIEITILPELGGRIHRAYDKTNGYDFVYHNEVIKPALVGLTGPWISGGIEFNWPQHHRPSTFLPVDFLLRDNPDGSKSVCVSETDRMYGTKGMAVFTLYPGKAYLEIRGQLYNGTPLPQTFLWWANPAVAVNDDTRSIFPPDVHAVMDHGKRDVSRFPIATGVYYKHDYGAGVDISRYKNIPVPTSYMACSSQYDFVGGYDCGKEAGILHVADHHVSPGKKQWTWGCGDFGKAWDRNLTDANGPYIELMTGVFTDNQPDFTWLKPYEEKTFTQYFMPYKKVAGVKNANTEIVMNVEREGASARICVYATAKFPGCRIVLKNGNAVVYGKTALLSPVDIFEASVPDAGNADGMLSLAVFDAGGNLMLEYTEAEKGVEKMPEPARSAKRPKEIASLEELLLTGMHIEQYRHATFDPDPYYLEGLSRDPGDTRINTAYGTLLLRRGYFAGSEAYFRAAIARLTERNPNPYSGEAFYCLGLSLFFQDRYAESFDAFYKATWSAEQQEMAFYWLAALSMRKGRFAEALEFADRSLVKNGHNLKARGLRAAVLRKLGMKNELESWVTQNLAHDPFDYMTRFEGVFAGLSPAAETLAMMRNESEAFLGAGIAYAEWGLYAEAIEVLAFCTAESPMLKYHAAFYASCLGRLDESPVLLAAAARSSPLYCFPNRLEDIAVLRYATATGTDDARAPYYLGNLLYDRKNYSGAIEMWERSAAIDSAFPTVWRNLSFAYFNKAGMVERSLAAMEKAFMLDPTDARVFFELDQLRRKTGAGIAERLRVYEDHPDLVELRDDLYVEYLTLLNMSGKSGRAHELVLKRKFHPWEGGEGKVTAQYAASLVDLAVERIRARDGSGAIALLEAALRFPENLGEGKLSVARDNDIKYWLGCALEAAGDAKAAAVCWLEATAGDQDPSGVMYYNDQPAHQVLYQGLAFRKLGQEEKARSRFHKLVDYGEQHLFDTVTIDYFAVSLPDLQLFDENLDVRNQAHCHYLIALGAFGLGDIERSKTEFDETLKTDRCHVDAILQERLCYAVPN